MRVDIRNLTEATDYFQDTLAKRQIKIQRIESKVKTGNSRLFTESGEVYHLKFTRKPFRPDADKRGPARELHLKLHFAMENFEYRSGTLLTPSERGTMVGIDEDLLLHLLDLVQKGLNAYVVTILGRGMTLWLEANDFYNFVMRYDTFIKFPRSGVPVCFAPTGYFLPWANPIIQPPSLVE